MFNGFFYTTHFKKCYKNLSLQVRDRVKKTLRLLADNPHHPSLRMKKMEGTADIWEVWVSMDMRITFQIRSDVLVLRKVGKHDILKNP